MLPEGVRTGGGTRSAFGAELFAAGFGLAGGVDVEAGTAADPAEVASAGVGAGAGDGVVVEAGAGAGAGGRGVASAEAEEVDGAPFVGASALAGSAGAGGGAEGEASALAILAAGLISSAFVTAETGRGLTFLEEGRGRFSDVVETWERVWAPLAGGGELA